MHFAIRVDATAQMGTGHFMRCLTLADGARAAGGSVRMVSRQLPPHLAAMVADHGHELTMLTPLTTVPTGDTYADWLGVSVTDDAAETAEVLADRRWDWVGVDHYALDATWETAMRQVAARVLVIDDLADRRHDCDLLLDQNYYADMATRYRDKVPGGCRQMLGPRYALLRHEFAVGRTRACARTGAVRRVLVAFGGTDSANDTRRVVDALTRAPLSAAAVDVVISAGHQDRDAIGGACASAGFACHVQPSAMSDLMLSADIAIGAGGMSTWERCCLGVPSFVWVVADNQRQQVADAAREGWIYAPDPPTSGADDEWIERHVHAFADNATGRGVMSAAAMRAVDGRGVERVIGELAGGGLEVRVATVADSQQLFTWRNHPSVRQASRGGEPIEWSDHERWLASVVADPQRVLLIGYLDGEPRGVVRFDIENDAAEVSIYLVPGTASTGTGGRLLVAAERWFAAARTDVRRFRAFVLDDNVPSHRMFTGAGYRRESAWYSKQVMAS